MIDPINITILYVETPHRCCCVKLSTVFTNSISLSKSSQKRTNKEEQQADRKSINPANGAGARTHKDGAECILNYSGETLASLPRAVAMAMEERLHTVPLSTRLPPSVFVLAFLRRHLKTR